MMMFAIILIIISLFTSSQAFSSPVLLWSNADFPQSAVPLSTLSPLDVISNYICKLDSEQVEVHLFAVDELRNENIHQSSHPILIDAKKENSQYLYIPSVADDVYKTFSLIPQSNNMQCSHIRFRIASSVIYQTLEEALNAMQTSLNRMEPNLKTVTVMGLISSPVVYQSSIRQRRDVEVDEGDVVVSDDQSCMLYAEKLYREYANQPSAGNYSLNLDESSCKPVGVAADNKNASAVILDLVWDNEKTGAVKMTLIANITGRYWYLTSANINNTEYRYFAYGMHSKMDTPPSFSYVCSDALFVKYKPEGHGSYDFQDKFYITSFQFQPFNANGSYFGPPNYCTSFFTSGIWMGITSSLLCLGILLVGVSRMMAIKSNDRFDDPKGKPLIIKAQE